MAERVGFEPTDEDRSSPVFKTGAFNRSATFPKENRIIRNFVKQATSQRLVASLEEFFLSLEYEPSVGGAIKKKYLHNE